MLIHLAPFVATLLNANFVPKMCQRISDVDHKIGVCLWDRWLGSGSMTFARDSLIRTLGKREGERLSGAIHVDTIPATELRLLGELALEGFATRNTPIH